MKLIIAGSRDLNDEKDIRSRIHKIVSQFVTPVTEIVSGKARGPDQIGESYAKMVGIPIKEMPADWNKHGRKAGPLRNADMAEYADGAIVFWDGKSAGAKNMIHEMSKRKKPCLTVIISN